jgi:hypothetical protein
MIFKNNLQAICCVFLLRPTDTPGEPIDDLPETAANRRIHTGVNPNIRQPATHRFRTAKRRRIRGPPTQPAGICDLSQTSEKSWIT